MVTARPEDADLQVLSDEECWQLVRTQTVGRFAANRPRMGPLVVPVNYTVADDRTVVFRTGAGAKLHAVGHGLTVIQVDEIDPLHHTGWSVLVEGTTAWLYAEQDRTVVETWAPGPHPYVVRMTPVRVSGRRLRLPPLPETDGRGYR